MSFERVFFFFLGFHFSFPPFYWVTEWRPEYLLLKIRCRKPWMFFMHGVCVRMNTGMKGCVCGRERERDRGCVCDRERWNVNVCDICTCVCMSVCMCMFRRTHITHIWHNIENRRVCTGACARACTHAHTHTQGHTRTCILYAHTCRNRHKYTHQHTHIHTHTHTHTRTHIHTQTLSLTHTHAHTHTHARNTRPNTYTYHTYIQQGLDRAEVRDWCSIGAVLWGV